MRKIGVKEVFSDDWRHTVFWLAVAFAALIVGFACGWAWRDRPRSLAGVRIIDVLTAIGTVGTAIIALWLGLRQSMREDKIGEVKARGIAVVLTVRLDNARGLLHGLRLKVSSARMLAAQLRSQRLDCTSAQTEERGTSGLETDHPRVDAPEAEDNQAINSKILKVVDDLKSDFRTLLNQCSAIAGYEEIEALAFAPNDLSHRLAREVTHAEYIQPVVESYWWVFTASCLRTVPGIEETNALDVPLKRCEALAEKFRRLANDLDSFSREK